MSPIVDSAASSAPLSSHSALLAMTVDLDKSVFVQMVFFALLVVVLKPLLFDPMLRLFTLREERTEGARAAARDMSAQSEQVLAKYQAEVESARRRAAESRDQVRKEAAQAEAKILEEAQASAHRVIEDGRAQIGAELESLKAELAKRAPELSRQIGSAVLGRELRS